jgi:polyribonucleotide nucleotidyltransferase
LSDILGDEDHLGDMDFKVTGTRDGICGIQMDIKVDGLSMDVMRAALSQARQGRLHILDAMYECIPVYNPDLKPHTPRVEQIIIDAEFIGAIIGPGGKIIQEIQRETSTKISVDEKEGKGYVKVFSDNKDNLDKAMTWIKGIVQQPEVGETYEGTVKSIMPFGAFIEFMPGKQGLLHISEVSWSRLDSLEGVMKEGDKVKIKLVGTDPKTGKLRLSRKALMEKPAGYVEPEARERSGDRGERREGGGGRERRDGDRGGERRSGGDRGERRERPERGDRPERPKREFGADDAQTEQQQPQQAQAVQPTQEPAQPQQYNPADDADLAL